MVLPAPTANGAGVRLRVLGIPVRFDTWFFIIGVLLSIRQGIAVVVLWLVVLGGSVLVHELGHALVARTTGAKPEIVIHALGGLTSWQPTGEVSRGRRVAISLAGPAAGIALGLVFLALEAGGVGDDGGLAELALYLGIRVNILYGLFNLLPILPLDGGQTLRDLLPGAAASRERTAAIVSVVVGVVTAIAAFVIGEPFAAIFVVFFVAGNIATLSGGRAKQRPAAGQVPGQPQRPRTGPLADYFQRLDAGDLTGAAEAAERAAAAADARGDYDGAVTAVHLAAHAHLSAGNAAAAKSLLLELPAGAVQPVMEGRVLLATGQPALGLQRLEQAFGNADDATAHAVAVALVGAGAHHKLVEIAEEPSRPARAVLGAARGALDAGAAAVAGRLAEAAGARSTGAEFALAAFTAGRAWALAGERERALLALRAAVSADERYAAAAAADSAFATVRGADYDEIVRR